METGIWVFYLPLCGALALAAVLGYWHDKGHRPGRAYLFSLTNADIDRARTMCDYYSHVRGAER
jgi:hypothetical protein